MSVINKMLQDLDRRQALGGASDPAVVRPQVARAGGHEWFWRVVGVLLAIALAWMGWVAWQIMPRKPLATDLAFQAAAEARSRAAARPAAPAPAPAAAAPAPAPVAPAAPAEPSAAPTAPNESLKLALQLETPVREKEPEAAVPAEPAPAPAPAKPQAAPAAKAAAKAAAPAPTPPPAAKSTLDKRDRARSASDNAEAHFRRAALLLNHGRVSEAEDQLVAALHADPLHAAARQTYVALLLEQQRVDVARRLLQQAVAINPEQATFALALARIHTEQGDYLAALDVMDRAGSVSRNPDFQALRGAALQRLNRHGDAVEAYQNAIRGGSQPATTWVSYGISLESIGRRSEAAQAYRRALAAGQIPPEAREYAENRARALD